MNQEILKRELNQALRDWFLCADPKQRQAAGRRAAELQAKYEAAKKKPAPGVDQGGHQMNVSASTKGGRREEL